MTSSFSKSLGNAWQSTKKAASDAKKKAQERMTMEGLLTQARISLEHYLDPKIIPSEERMSQDILRNAMGIAFITEAKGGFIVGIKGGSGIIMVKKQSKSARKKKKKLVAPDWSAPCAVGTGGLSVGFLAGAAKVDHIIILSSQDQVDIFLSNGQLQLKGNANATAAKWGRNAEAGIGVGTNKQTASNKQSVAPFYTYSFGNKGLYGGVSLDGEVLAVRKDCNEAFYGKTVHVKDVLLGAVKMPKKNKDYNSLVSMLKEYCVAMEDDEKFGMDFPVTPPQGSTAPNTGNKQYKGAQTRNAAAGNKQYKVPQNQYVDDNETNRAAMNSIAQNKEAQKAGRSAMKDQNVRNAAFNAYKSGGNDKNANKELAKNLAKNKEVQGAAVSVAKDEKVQKAAWQTTKKNANKKNLAKAKKMMFSKKSSDDV